MSELYKVFKVIDDTNDGQITQKELSKFIEDVEGVSLSKFITIIRVLLMDTLVFILF